MRWSGHRTNPMISASSTTMPETVTNFSIWASLFSRIMLGTFRKTRSYLHPLSGKSIRTFAICTVTSTQDLLFSVLNGCSDAKHVYQAHGFMVVRGLDLDNLYLSRFIDTCSQLGVLEHGYLVFSHKTQIDIYLYNTMIKALVSGHRFREAIFLYSKTRLSGLQFDSYSFPFALKAVARLSAVELGRKIHCQAIATGLNGQDHVASALIHMYTAVDRVSDACKVFDGMPVRNLGSWNAMVSGHVKVGDVDSARVMFEQMPERDVISWTTLIAGYAQVNRPAEALSIFTRMQLHHILPDAVTISAALSACAQLGALELGEWFHNYILENKLTQTIPLSNALIDMYAKSGNVNKAIHIFEKMKHKSVVTWTTAIGGLAFHGLGREALEMFSRMERSDIRPTDVTLVAVLSACSHSGLIETGRWFFKNMVSRYGIKPRIEHYGCMVDLLGRGGCLREAEELVTKMPFEASEAIWGSLLAASRIYGEVELGEIAMQHLLNVEPHNSGNYSLMCNIYADFGRWDDSWMMRRVLRDSGVEKMRGSSCIEVNKRVHEFHAGDRSHPQSERIYKVISQFNHHLKITRESLDHPLDDKTRILAQLDLKDPGIKVGSRLVLEQQIFSFPAPQRKLLDSPLVHLIQLMVKVV